MHCGDIVQTLAEQDSSGAVSPLTTRLAEAARTTTTDAARTKPAAIR